MASGLYKELSGRGLLVRHSEVSDLTGFGRDGRRHKIIRPERVPFVSYPYEWSFSQLKEAALLTLELQNVALSRGMVLKDASAYNVQFIGRKPVFIDTLSFKKYESGTPWEAYKQFCEHFIVPLALASYGAPEILKTLRVFLDGIPLSTGVRLLPAKARLKRGLAAHVFLHAASQKKYDNNAAHGPAKVRRVSPLAMSGLMASLERTIKGLNLPKKRTEWGDYYNDTNYTSESFDTKRQLVAQLLAKTKPSGKEVWDLGANDGTFSELAAELGAYTLSFDIDPIAVDKNFNRERDDKLNSLILPLSQDLSNPSPALGWAHGERMSLVSRGPAHTVLALALIHHLAIGNNSPLSSIAEFMATLSRNVIIEFVPREDSKVQLLLRRRNNSFSDYTVENFEAAFASYFKLIKRQPIKGSKRTLYLYEKKA